MPLRLLRSRSLSDANTIRGLVGASTFAMWFFLSLYVQDVLHLQIPDQGGPALPCSCR